MSSLMVSEETYVKDRHFHGRPNRRPTQRTTDIPAPTCCEILRIIIILIGICSTVLYFSVRGIFVIQGVPKFDVNDISLTEFALSPTNNTLYYNLAVNVTFRNPSNRVGIHFDKVKAIAMYRGQELMSKPIQGFYLRHKKENTNVTTVFEGERLLMLYNGDEKVLYKSESKDGVYNIELKLLFVTRTRAWSLNTFKYTSKVVWGLKVPLLRSKGGKVSTTKFETTTYSYEENVDWDTD